MASENEHEARLRQQLEGRIPTRAEFLKNQLKQRRYFDSGDYAMSKAGKKPESGQEIGSEHPNPEQISHRSALLAATGGDSSPVRRPSSLAVGSEVVRVAASREREESEEEAVSDP